MYLDAFASSLIYLIKGSDCWSRKAVAMNSKKTNYACTGQKARDLHIPHMHENMTLHALSNKVRVSPNISLYFQNLTYWQENLDNKHGAKYSRDGIRSCTCDRPCASCGLTYVRGSWNNQLYIIWSYLHFLHNLRGEKRFILTQFYSDTKQIAIWTWIQDYLFSGRNKDEEVESKH